MNYFAMLEYKEHLKERNKFPEIAEHLTPCEHCGEFMLLDFDICPICGHQQSVD